MWIVAVGWRIARTGVAVGNCTWAMTVGVKTTGVAVAAGEMDVLVAGGALVGSITVGTGVADAGTEPADSGVFAFARSESRWALDTGVGSTSRTPRPRT